MIAYISAAFGSIDRCELSSRRASPSWMIIDRHDRQQTPHRPSVVSQERRNKGKLARQRRTTGRRRGRATTPPGQNRIGRPVSGWDQSRICGLTSRSTSFMCRGSGMDGNPLTKQGRRVVDANGTRLTVLRDGLSLLSAPAVRLGAESE
jgi:hypothetical protein